MTSATASLLAERIQFFFSDSNFRQDQFMLKEASSNDGYIEISSLLKFNSIKKISTDAKLIAQAAKEVGSVVVSKDGEAIRRKDPLPDQDDTNLRTVYVTEMPVEEEKGGEAAGEEPEEEAAKEEPKEEPAAAAATEPAAEPKKQPKARKTFRYAATVADVQAAFAAHGDVALVRMRFSRADPAKGVPKSAIGGAFVEFRTEGGLEKCVEAAKGEAAKVNGKEVKVQRMVDWLAAGKKGKGNSNKKAGGEKKPKEEKPKEEEKPLEVVPISWEKNTVLSFVAVPDGCDRETIKDAFAGVEGLDAQEDLYIDYSRGESDGAVRFKRPFAGIGDLAAKFKAGELTVGGEKVGDALVLGGDVEEKYWQLAAEQMAERKRARERGDGGKGRDNRNNKRQRR
ncbi:hypothetical protein TeGR_g8056 [Tetraparma gracilis]|uniref:Lupus La protein n=1 Tax=Tetraparma gracilis TaxID=2962635 RepID=A0ABQ6MDG3_9STRA|nr:hypothetical protein TeGR_g8056 [Tetraparma gracilis]